MRSLVLSQALAPPHFLVWPKNFCVFHETYFLFTFHSTHFPPLLFLFASLSHVRFSNCLISRLAAPFVIIALQVRAHGLTNKPLNFDLTPEELAAGRHQAKKSSIYTGVNWFKSKGLWRAIGWMDGKRTHLGLHDTEIEAARAYDKWAHPLGKNLNFPDDYKGQKVATLAYVRPAALPEEEARARAMSLSADRAAFEASRPFSSRSFTGEILAQELHDLQTNAASLKKIPTKRGPPKDRSLLPIVVRAKGKGSVKAKKKKSHLRNIESDDSSSSGSDIGSDSSSDSSSDGSSSDGDDNDKENKKEWSSSKATANKTNGPGDESSQEPSDYELLRLQNIARNQAMMEALGLDSGNKSSNRHKRSDKHSKKKSAKDKDASKESTTATKKAPAKNSKWACHMVQYSARIVRFISYVFHSLLHPTSLCLCKCLIRRVLALNYVMRLRLSL